MSFIPIPAFDTDPNSGQTYGILPVWLFRDDSDAIRTIIAPSVTYNEFIGVTGTFRVFTYPSALERLQVVGGYSSKIEREVDLWYRNLGIFGGRFHLELRVLHDRDSTIRFYGLGPDSRPQDETNMTLGTTGGYAVFGVNITPTIRLSLGDAVQNFTVRQGGVPGLPFTGDRFPELPGVTGAFVHAQRLALIHDSRDSLQVPTRGLKATAFTEVSSRLLGSESDYVKAGVESVLHRPIWSDRAVLVLRGLVEGLAGDSRAPFQVLPSVGGETTLRGFGDNRFFDAARILANAETRFRPIRLHLFGVTAELEIAPFVDVGMVFDSLRALLRGPLRVTPGVGLRGLAKPSVVGHIDIGVSSEGPAIFVGLDYPF